MFIKQSLLSKLCPKSLFVRRCNIHFYSNNFRDIENVSIPTVLFPKGKYAYVGESVQAILSGLDSSPMFSAAPSATVAELKVAHDEHYIKRVFDGTLSKAELQKLGFSWSESMVKRVTGSAGATIAAMRYVCSQNAFVDTEGVLVDFDHRSTVACHLGGGTHHAFYDYGEGFCVFNDLAIAAILALREYPQVVRRVLVVDLDVHQGNGTVGIVNKLDGLSEKVWTFSMHCEGNIFSPVEYSTVDIALPRGCSDAVYLEKLGASLPCLFDEHKPDLVLYQSGVDAHGDDRLGKCSLTAVGLSQRNKLLFQAIKDYNSSAAAAAARSGDNVGYCRLVVTMGGGYPRSIDPDSGSFQHVVQLHSNVFTEAFHMFR